MRTVYNAEHFGERGIRTRSASESSSCPIMLLFLRHRATRPSMKSKKRPKGRKARARYRLPLSDGSPRQYRSEEKTDRIPQAPTKAMSQSSLVWEGPL